MRPPSLPLTSLLVNKFQKIALDAVSPPQLTRSHATGQAAQSGGDAATAPGSRRGPRAVLARLRESRIPPAGKGGLAAGGKGRLRPNTSLRGFLLLMTALLC